VLAQLHRLGPGPAEIAELPQDAADAAGLGLRDAPRVVNLLPGAERHTLAEADGGRERLGNGQAAPARRERPPLAAAPREPRSAPAADVPDHGGADDDEEDERQGGPRAEQPRRPPEGAACLADGPARDADGPSAHLPRAPGRRAGRTRLRLDG